MGINIGISRYKGTEWINDKQVHSWEWWDGCRHTGDSEFIGDNFEKVYKEGIDYTEIVWRPKNFDEARKYVLESKDIPDGNKPRLLDLLSKLENDEELWINVSY